jgi:hypothetical protein
MTAGIFDQMETWCAINVIASYNDNLAKWNYRFGLNDPS